MRYLYLLRGAPGSGKSTWVKNNNLQPYTLSADNIRQMVSGLTYNMKGEPVIPQEYDSQVWNLLLERLEERMDRGEFVIVDATHYRAALLQQYKKLINKYRYRAFVINFTDVPEETALQRNQLREPYKFVPPNTIRKMYRVFESDRKEVSNRFKILSRKEAIEELYKPMLFNYNKYNNIYIFGDIHGCNEPLQNFFNEHPMQDDAAYIFTGDYLDRGIQNKEVMEFLLSIYNKDNVLLLEGNHERWLRMYAEEEAKQLTQEEKAMLKPYVDKSFWRKMDKSHIRNRGFKEKTAPQLSELDKKELRQFCRRLGQMAYITFRGKNYYISHGGTPMLPNIFVPASKYIEGTGKYEDVDSVYEYWEIHRNDNDILIHAHRNIFDYDTKINDHCYNLCDTIEYGGNLRVLEIKNDGTIQTYKYKNNVYDQTLAEERKQKAEIQAHLSENELVNQLNSTNLIRRKELSDGIISYNFTRSAFEDKRWNQMTVTARGLFMQKDKVVARSYDKFFNWGENDTVTSRALHDKLVFPVKAYRKENGFLAIVSQLNNQLAVYSKSTNTGDYVGYIKAQLETFPSDTKKQICNYCKEHNCSFVFECIDPINDPHIVKYYFPHLILLDIIQNDLKMQKLPYEGYKGLRAVANQLGLEYKTHEYTFYNWQELFDFIKQQDANFTPWENFLEGWVFEDANGYMVKYKTPTYKWWKRNRTILEKIQHRHEVKPIYTCEEDAILFNLLDRLQKENKLGAMNILDIQEAFYQIERPKKIKDPF